MNASDSNREVLQSRRPATIVAATHVWSPGGAGEMHEGMLLTFGFYPDGRIGEVFINMEKHQNERSIMLGHDIATVLSIAIQYGAPIDVLAGAVGRGDVNRMGKVVLMPHTIIGTVLDHMLEEQIRTLAPALAEPEDRAYLKDQPSQIDGAPDPDSSLKASEETPGILAMDDVALSSESSHAKASEDATSEETAPAVDLAEPASRLAVGRTAEAEEVASAASSHQHSPGKTSELEGVPSRLSDDEDGHADCDGLSSEPDPAEPPANDPSPEQPSVSVPKAIPDSPDKAKPNSRKVWTDDKVQLLRDLAGKGLDCNRLAARMTELSDRVFKAASIKWALRAFGIEDSVEAMVTNRAAGAAAANADRADQLVAEAVERLGGENRASSFKPRPALALRQTKVLARGHRFRLTDGHGNYLHWSCGKMVRGRQNAWAGTEKQLLACRQKFDLARDLREELIAKDEAR